MYIYICIFLTNTKKIFTKKQNVQKQLREINNLAQPYLLNISRTIKSFLNGQIKSLSLHFFSFQKVPFLSFNKQINLCCTDLTTMVFQTKLLSHCFSKSKNYGYETFQNVAPILHSVICFEMNTASITNKRLL